MTFKELYDSKKEYLKQIDKYQLEITNFLTIHHSNKDYPASVKNVDIHVSTDNRFIPAELTVVARELDWDLLIHFTNVFEYYLPVMEIKEFDKVYDYTGVAFTRVPLIEYKFRKKIKWE